MAKAKRVLRAQNSPCVERMAELKKGMLDDPTGSAYEIYDAIVDEYNRSGGLIPLRKSDIVDGGSKDLESVVKERLKADQEWRKTNAIRAEIQSISEVLREFPENPALGLRSLWTGLRGRLSTAATPIANAYRSVWHGRLMNELSEPDWDLLNGGTIDREIFIGLYARHNDGKLPDNISEPAGRITDALIKLEDEMVGTINGQGGTIGRVAGGIIRQAHDAASIKGNEAGWKQLLEAGLDYEAVFGSPKSEIDPVLLKNQIDEWYETLSTGAHEISLSANGGLGNSRRVIIFKDGESAHRYFTEYGQSYKGGNLWHSVQQRISNNSRTYGLSFRFGPSYTSSYTRMVNSMQQHLKQKIKNTTDEKVKASLRKQLEEVGNLKTDSAEVLEATGASNVPEKHGWHKADGFIKSWDVMRLLGSVTFSMLGDHSASAHVMAKWTRGDPGRFQGLMDGLVGWTTKFKNQNVRDAFVRQAGIGLETMGGSHLNDITQADPMLGWFGKMGAFFNKVNLAGPLTDASKRQRGMQLSAAVADFGRMSWDEISADAPDVAQMFEAWGIKKYHSAFKDMAEFKDGSDELFSKGFYLDAGTIDRMPVDHPAIIQLSNELQVSPRMIKQDLSTRLAAGFSEEINAAVVTPGARVKSMTKLGTQAGTGARFLVNRLMTFKNFPFAIMDQNILGEFRVKYGQAVKQGMDRGEARGAALKAGGAGLGIMLAQATIMGAAALYLRDFSKGQQRDWTRYESWSQAMLTGGALGIYGDFLLGDMKNRYGGSMLDTLAGPSIGTASQVMDIIQRVRDSMVKGDTEADVAASIFRLGMSSMPMQNHFATRFAVEHFWTNAVRDWMNPGSVERARKRYTENTGIEFLLER